MDEDHLAYSERGEMHKLLEEIDATDKRVLDLMLMPKLELEELEEVVDWIARAPTGTRQEMGCMVARFIRIIGAFYPYDMYSSKLAEIQQYLPQILKGLLYFEDLIIVLPFYGEGHHFVGLGCAHPEDLFWELHTWRKEWDPLDCRALAYILVNRYLFAELLLWRPRMVELCKQTLLQCKKKMGISSTWSSLDRDVKEMVARLFNVLPEQVDLLDEIEASRLGRYVRRKVSVSKIRKRVRKCYQCGLFNKEWLSYETDFVMESLLSEESLWRLKHCKIKLSEIKTLELDTKWRKFNSAKYDNSRSGYFRPPSIWQKLDRPSVPDMFPRLADYVVPKNWTGHLDTKPNNFFNVNITHASPNLKLRRLFYQRSD